MERNKLSVTQLNNYIKGVFDDELILKNIAVFGEVYECSESGGNLYLTLKDESSILRCVRFSGGLIPEIGETVIVTGSVNYYVKGNRISFHVRDIQPYGEGAIHRELQRLKEQLKKEGLFDNHPPMPLFIRKVGVVTSETGAVIHDLRSVIGKRHGYIDIEIFPVKVQGEGAAEQIAEAVKKACVSDCDVLVIARGGGSSSDLEPFNTEIAARAVAASVIPVISAVGHEVDYTLCDFSATLRAGTPSIAGENICRINEQYTASVYALLMRMSAAVNRLYLKSSNSICRSAKRLSDCAGGLLYGGKLRLYDLTNRLKSVAVLKYSAGRKSVDKAYRELVEKASVLYKKKEENFGRLAGELNAANPLNIIQKGYAKVYSGGVPLLSADSLKKGDRIDVVLKDGIVKAETLSVKQGKVTEE